MTTDRGITDRLTRGAEDLQFDPDAALARFHRVHDRRRVVRRGATIVAALVIALVGLAGAWLLVPGGDGRSVVGSTAPQGPTGPVGTLALITYDPSVGEGEVAIATTDAAEPDLVPLVDGPYAIFPIWSPDGSKLAYATGEDDTAAELTVANADGSDPRGLGVILGGPYSWSPDSTTLAFIAQEDPDGRDVVSTIRADGTDLQQMVGGLDFQSVSWSPDGRHLALVGQPSTQGNISGPEGWDLYVVDIATGGLTPLTRTERWEHFAFWSPDGSTIVFSASGNFDDADYPSDLFSIGADGTGERQLTDWEGFDSFPAWSPDGAWIAFASDRDATTEQQRANRQDGAFANISIFVMRADGSDPRLLLRAGEDQTLLPTSWRS